MDNETQTYTMSAYLIAQLGKNFANEANKRITGDELLEADVVELSGGTYKFTQNYRTLALYMLLYNHIYKT